MKPEGDDEPPPKETDLSKEDITDRADPRIEREHTRYAVEVGIGKDGVSMKATGESPPWSPAAISGAFLTLVVAGMLVGACLATISIIVAAPATLTIITVGLVTGAVVAVGTLMIKRHTRH